MTDRITYNEETGKVEVDADIWDMIVDQLPGQCIVEHAKIKKLWKDKALRDTIAQHLGIASNTTYHPGLFSGTKNKFSLAELYPECIVMLPTTTQSKHEFQKLALVEVPKVKLQKMKDYSNHSMQVALDNLLSGRTKNPTISTIVAISKITGVPIHRFVRSILPQYTPREMARIKQIALTEKTSIMATVIRELELTHASIAGTLGVNKCTISGWVHGAVPRLDGYVAICKYFNVPFDYFSDWLE